MRRLVIVWALVLATLVVATPAFGQQGTEQFSSPEADRLYEEWQATKADYDEVSAQDEACLDDPECPYEESQELNQREIALDKELGPLGEDTAAARLAATQDAPVEGSDTEQIATLEKKRDALRALQSWTDENVGGWVESDANSDTGQEIKVVEARIEELESAEAQPADSGSGDGGGGGGQADGGDADGGFESSSDEAAGGLNLGPVMMLALLVGGGFFVAHRIGLIGDFRGARGIPTAPPPPKPRTGAGAGSGPQEPSPTPPGGDHDGGPVPGSGGPEPEDGRSRDESGGVPPEDTDDVEWSLPDEEDDERWGPPPPSVNQQQPQSDPGGQTSETENQHQGEKTALQQYGRDLTAMARAGKISPLIGRTEEVARAIRTLSRRTKNNPVLVGEAGVGKTAIAEGLARMIVASDAPKALEGKRLVELDLAAIESGTVLRGMYEARLEAVVQEVEHSGNVILFVDEIHRLMSSGTHDGKPSPAVDILKPALARGEVTVIGATTLDEYRHVEADPAMERRLQPVRVKPLTVGQTVELLERRREEFENEDLSISDDAIEAAAKLSERYMPQRNLPDKAIDVLDEACAELRGKGEVGTVTATAIATVVGEMTGIQVAAPGEDELANLDTLEERLGQHVKGQAAAIEALAGMIRLKRFGLADESKPLSAMFFGPTGTGKTYLAKTLAAELFGSEQAMVRLDMSEYQNDHDSWKLLGSARGHVHSDSGGALTEPVRRNPYSVVLLDEIEKANPEVLTPLLQLLDDGRLTDGMGREINFRETIVLMTTNARAELVLEASEGGYELTDEGVKSELVAFGMRSEFVNRIGAICPFYPLQVEQVEEIAGAMLAQTARRLKGRGISMSYEPTAVTMLAYGGYSPQNGVRYLAGQVAQTVDEKIAGMIQRRELEEGDTVVVAVREGGITAEVSRKEQQDGRT